MAFADDQDPTGGTGTDWWTQNAPPPTDPNVWQTGGTASPYETVAQFYRTALGREGSPADIQAWIDGTGGNIAQIQQGIFGSAEAQAYSARTAGTGAPVVVTGGGGGGGGGGSTSIGVPTTGFGAAPTPYTSDANAPTYTPMPTYVPPTWTGGDFKNPTVEDLYASPGYQARLDRRLQGDSRRFAAQGTILNGGTLKALDRDAQDYATGEYQTLRNNSYDAYVQKYKQFTDTAGMDLNARTVNANENQNTFANRTATYAAGNSRTLSDYLTNLTAKRNSELDYWNRLQDVSSGGASLAGGSR